MIPFQNKTNQRNKETKTKKIPQSLCLHLNRITPNPFTGGLMKNNHFVKFGYSLKIESLVTGDSKENSGVYILDAVIVHLGSNYESGHYITYRRCPKREMSLKPKIKTKSKKKDLNATYISSPSPQKVTVTINKENEMIQNEIENSFWISISDDVINYCTEDDVFNANAYMLFYHKLSY